MFNNLSKYISYKTHIQKWLKHVRILCYMEFVLHLQLNIVVNSIGDARHHSPYIIFGLFLRQLLITRIAKWGKLAM